MISSNETIIVILSYIYGIDIISTNIYDEQIIYHINNVNNAQFYITAFEFQGERISNSYIDIIAYNNSNDNYIGNYNILTSYSNTHTSNNICGIQTSLYKP